MKRICMTVGVTLTTALFGGAMISACAHNDASIFIRQVFAPAVPSNGACVFTADPTQSSISGGQADLAFSSLGTYTPEILVGNQIFSQANMTALQPETSRVFITGAITRVEDLTGNTSLVTLFGNMCMAGDQAACDTVCALEPSIIAGDRGCPADAKAALTTPTNPFSTAETGTIEAANGTTPEYTAMGMTFVDGATVSAIRFYFEDILSKGTDPSLVFSTSIELRTFTKAEGTTEGGDPEESNEFQFPVTFTFGTLATNLEFSDSPDYPAGACVGAVSSAAQGTCVAGQDAVSAIGVIRGLPGYPDIPLCNGVSGSTVVDAGGD
jgi:hypothetical protein